MGVDWRGLRAGCLIGYGCDGGGVVRICCIGERAGTNSRPVSVNPERKRCNNINDTVSNSIIVPPFLCNSYMPLEERAAMGINIPHSTPDAHHAFCLFIQVQFETPTMHMPSSLLHIIKYPCKDKNKTPTRQKILRSDYPSRDSV
jgi:hypothetical protein